jgi:VIT1/CCC1 family predicted Fe2+/Mn2+ transporter
VERRHIRDAPEGEREEIREILRGLEISGDLLERVVSVITADRERWVRMMLRYEYGLPAMVRSPWRAACATFWAFLICGLVPLLPFAAGLQGAFRLSSAVTGLLFLLIGALKSRWSMQPWWDSSVSTLLVGGAAAAVAYGIGTWLRNITV